IPISLYKASRIRTFVLLSQSQHPRLGKSTYNAILTSMPLFPYLKKLKLGMCSLKPLEQTLRMKLTNMATLESLTSIATSTSSSSTIVDSSFIPLSKLKFMTIVNMEETLPKELMCNLISLQDLSCGPLPLSQHLIALRRLIINGSNDVLSLLENCPDIFYILELEWDPFQRLDDKSNKYHLIAMWGPQPWRTCAFVQ
ncbi:hypothetical protein CFP56_032366, partial [Quercus suber]